MLNSVIINTLHVGIYMIELFYKAAITSIHVILLQILAVISIVNTIIYAYTIDYLVTITSEYTVV